MHFSPAIVVKLLLLLLSAGPSYSQNLSLTLTDLKLGTPRSYIKTVYDGDDSIYLFGGIGAPTEILKYSITNETIELVGRLPSGVCCGTVALLGDDAYYFGGYNGGAKREIRKYHLNDLTTSEMVGNLPEGLDSPASVVDGVGNIYLVGGQGVNKIYKFSTVDHQVEMVGVMESSKGHPGAIWRDGSIYIFGGYNGSYSYSNEILKYDADTQIITKLNNLTSALTSTCVISNGADVFVLAPFPPESSFKVRFSISRNEVVNIFVENSPTSLRDAGCSFVEKNNRIYLFGGISAGNVKISEIMYIDLSNGEVTPPTTTTTYPATSTDGSFICPPTGIHNFPYPGNCSLYIRCLGGTPRIESCADDLLFDLIDLICKPRADAVCTEDPLPSTPEPTSTEAPEFTCPDDEYDTYPHSTNCSLYYVCFEGAPYTEKCAFGTYYDPAPSTKKCNLAELVTCNADCPHAGVHYLPIYTDTCSWFKICSDGESVNFKCPNGTVYDPDQEKCVGLDSYTCPYTPR